MEKEEEEEEEENEHKKTQVYNIRRLHLWMTKNIILLSFGTDSP